MTASVALPTGLAPGHQAWAEAALADGWTVDEESQRRVSPGERSFYLTKALPDGDVLKVWLIDRDSIRFSHEDCDNVARKHSVRNPDGTYTRLCRENPVREVWTAAWARNGLHAFDLPPVYDAGAITDAIGLCHTCKQVVGKENLRPLGFAGRICGPCDADGTIRGTVEFPGWYN